MNPPAPFSQNNYIQVPVELKVPSKGHNCDLSSVRTYVRFFEKKRAIDQRDVDLDELSNWLEYYDNLIAKKVQKLKDKVSTQNGELVSLRKRVEALADVLVSTANSQKIQQNAMNNQYGQRSLVMLLNKDLVEGDGVGDFEGLQKLGHNEVDSLLDLYDIDIERDEGIKNKKRKLHNYLLTGFSNL